MSKPSEVIFKDFIRWAEKVCPDWQYYDKDSFDLLMKAFTGGYMMSAQNSVEQARIKESMDLMSNVDISRIMQ